MRHIVKLLGLETIIAILFAIIIYLLFKIYALHKKLKYVDEANMWHKLAITDDLTGIHNRNAYNRQLADMKESFKKEKRDEIIAEIFPNITFETYSGLLAKRGQEVIKDQYGMIVLDELHRTGADEWGKRIDSLLETNALIALLTIGSFLYTPIIKCANSSLIACVPSILLATLIILLKSTLSFSIVNG